MPVVVGLDIATTTGLAIMQGDVLLHNEAFRPKGKTDYEIFHGFRVWLRPLLVSYGVQYAAAEEPLRSDLTRTETDEETGTEKKVPISTQRTFLRLYGLRAIAMEVCTSLNIDHYEVNQSTWRKAFLRQGRGGGSVAMKKMALAQCQMMRWPVTSIDAAEACGVAWWLGGELRMHNATLPGDMFFNQTQRTTEDEHAGR